MSPSTYAGLSPEATSRISPETGYTLAFRIRFLSWIAAVGLTEMILRVFDEKTLFHVLTFLFQIHYLQATIALIRRERRIYRRQTATLVASALLLLGISYLLWELYIFYREVWPSIGEAYFLIFSMHLWLDEPVLNDWIREPAGPRPFNLPTLAFGTWALSYAFFGAFKHFRDESALILFPWPLVVSALLIGSAILALRWRDRTRHAALLILGEGLIWTGVLCVFFEVKIVFVAISVYHIFTWHSHTFARYRLKSHSSTASNTATRFLLETAVIGCLLLIFLNLSLNTPSGIMAAITAFFFGSAAIYPHGLMHITLSLGFGARSGGFR